MKIIKRLSRREFAGSVAATALLSGLDVRELFAGDQTAVNSSLGGFGSSFEDTVDEIAFIQALIETHPDYFLQVRKHNDFDGAKKEAKLGIIFSFEGVECLGVKLERIELFRHLGVRVM